MVLTYDTGSLDEQDVAVPTCFDTDVVTRGDHSLKMLHMHEFNLITIDSLLKYLLQCPLETLLYPAVWNPQLC